MPRYALTPDRLFDRPWRPGHPFRPKCGRLRRLAMGVLLVALCGVILAYNYVTDPERVRLLAQEYLSELLDGQVTVRQAKLSVFEGMRLDGVRVYVDAPPVDGPAPIRAEDAEVFSAKSFVIQCDLPSLVRGKLEAVQIVAEKPHVHLSRDVRTGGWNLQRLGRKPKKLATPAPTPARPGGPPPIPDLLLRDARIELSEVRDGRREPLGFLSIDGRITPDAGGGRCGFVLQSRGASDAVGATVSGWVDLRTGHVTAAGERFEFGPDVQALLFEEVREVAARHGLAGRLDVPQFEYVPPRDGRPARFTVEAALRDVRLSLPPDELMSAAEVTRRADARAAVATVMAAYRVAGAAPPAPSPTRTSENAAASRGDAGTSRDREGAVLSNSPDRSLTVAARTDRSPNAAAVVPVAFTPDIGPGPAAPGRLPAPPRVAADPATPEASEDAPAPVDRSTPVGPLADLLTAHPVRLENVSGTFLLTEGGIEVRDVTGRLEHNAFAVAGRIHGYRPDAPLDLRVATLPGEDIHLPRAPRYLSSLPADVRDVYQDLRPEGRLRARFDFRRSEAGGPIRTDGLLEIVDGRFLIRDFPYPVRGVTGRVRFGRDERNGQDWLLLQDVRARGLPGGPNADTALLIDGWIGPLGTADRYPGIHMRIRSDEIRSEPALLAAFEPDVREALALFDAPGRGELPRFRAAVECLLTRSPGASSKLTARADVRLADATAMLVDFPYPLPGLTGELRVRDGYLDVIGLQARRGDATLSVDGRVVWDAGAVKVAAAREAAAAAGAGGTVAPQAVPGAPVRTDVRVTARGLPIDDALLAAVPPAERAWLKEAGVRGKLDVAGRLVGPPDPVPGSPGAPKRADDGSGDDDLTYDLAITLKDGTVRPRGGAFEATAVSGALRLTSDRLDVTELRGRRGGAELAARGRIAWAGGRTTVAVAGAATNLAADAALYELLPADARAAWDEVRPGGAADVEVTFGSDVPTGPGAAAAAVVPTIDLTRDLAGGSAKPAAPVPAVPAGLRAVIRPRGMSANLRSAPYALTDVTGTVAVSPAGVTLTDITARHGDGRLALSGTGATEIGPAGPRQVWDLKLAGDNLPIDDDLRAALPPSVADLARSLKLNGRASFRFDRFVHRGDDVVAAAEPSSHDAGSPVVPTAPPVRPAAPAVTADVPAPGVELAGSLTLADASLEAGVPLEKVNGTVNLALATRGGRLHAFKGDLNLASLTLAGRAVQQFRADLLQPDGRDELRVDKMHGWLAGGDLAGQVLLSYPAQGDSRYTLNLALRNADVRELAAESGKDVAGRVTASLAMEGAWGKPDARRGRGDVVASGRDMYRIPVILGLLQVTNLALPISSPFERAVARYNVDGQRVSFERVELRSNNMVMTGDGTLDFATRQVRMTFVTDNPGAFKVPFLQDLWRGAQQELLRIHVRGTVQDPKVQTGMFGTFTTTVDEVLKGDAVKKNGAPAGRRQ